MFKHNYGIRKNIALPLYITWDFGKSAWVVMVVFLFFYYQVIHINIPKEIEDQSLEIKPSPMYKATKAYADGRQKSSRNRARRRSKHSPYKV